MPIKLLALVSFGIALVAVYSLGFQSERDDSFEQVKDLPEIIHRIDRDYVDEVDVGKLMPGAFQHALERVDANAAYLPPGTSFRDETRALWRRTGLVLIKRDGYGYILSVAKGSPAAQAGLVSGSWIRRVNQVSTREQSALQLRHDLVHAKGEIQLRIVRPGSGDEADQTLIPGNYKLEALTHTVYEDGIHLLKSAHFGRGWARDLKKALASIDLETSKVALDLRGNAVGGPEEFAALCGLFLPQGRVGDWVGSKKPGEPLFNTKTGKFQSVTLYVIIDEGTSGAAEAFAAVARDMDKASVVGVKTLGLPSQYQYLPLPSGGTVYLSTRRFQLPSGKVLTGAGLDPDLVVKGEKREIKPGTEFLDHALRLIRRSQKG